MEGVQQISGMGCILRRATAVELLAELAHELPLGPSKTRVVLAHDQNALLAPPLALDLLGWDSLAAIALR